MFYFLIGYLVITALISLLIIIDFAKNQSYQHFRDCITFLFLAVIFWPIALPVIFIDKILLRSAILSYIASFIAKQQRRISWKEEKD